MILTMSIALIIKPFSTANKIYRKQGIATVSKARYLCNELRITGNPVTCNS